MSYRGRRWSLTINNWTEEELSDLKSLMPLHVTYLILGKETGEQGTPHLQGYLETPKKVTLGSLKTLAGLRRAHLEQAKGSAAENLTYCSKEDRDPFIGGEPMRQGSRTDLEEMKKMIDEGEPEITLWEKDFRTMVRNYKALNHYRSLKAQPRHWVTEVIVLVGPTGCGKTKWVFDMTQDENLSLWTYSSGGWFDGYDGQQVALFDDFYGVESKIDWDLLLKLCDRYPMKVPVKGGFREWCPKKIVITSNSPVHEWYPRQINQDAFWRRVAVFIDNDFWE